MDCETSPSSRVIAVVGAYGATHAEIVRHSGLSPERVDAGVKGALESRLLVRVGRTYHAANRIPKLPDAAPKGRTKRLNVNAAKPAPPTLSAEERARRLAEREANISRVVADRAAGKTLTEIGMVLGVTPSAVWLMEREAHRREVRTQKPCKRCSVVKPIAEFSAGYANCRPCAAELKRERRRHALPRLSLERQGPAA